MAYTDDETKRFGYCPACEDKVGCDPSIDFVCPNCGEPLRDLDELPASTREALRMIEWQKEVMRRGEWGPSPGGAAAELGCSRAMVDKLVAGGVLVRNEYHHERGRIHVVLISDASIEKAKANKAFTGQWTREG